MSTHIHISPRIARFGLALASFIVMLLGSTPAYAYLTPDQALNGLFSTQSPTGNQIPQLHPAIPTLNLNNTQIPDLPASDTVIPQLPATTQIPSLPSPDDIVPILPNGSGTDIVPILPIGSSSSSNNGSSGGNGGGNAYDPNCAAYGCPYNYPYYYPNQYYANYPDGYKPYPPVLSVGNNNSGAPLSHTGPGLIVGMSALALSALWTIRKAIRAEAMA